MFKKILHWFKYRRFYVIADASDNSITFSKKLFQHMNVMEQDKAQVFAFFIPLTKEFGFIINPDFDQETQLAEIQYNSKFKSIGFECLNPSVNRMFYDYHLPHNIKAKLSVEPRTIGDKNYYVILKPKPKRRK